VVVVGLSGLLTTATTSGLAVLELDYVGYVFLLLFLFGWPGGFLIAFMALALAGALAETKVFHLSQILIIGAVSGAFIFPVTWSVFGGHAGGIPVTAGVGVAAGAAGALCFWLLAAKDPGATLLPEGSQPHGRNADA
jgi:hypothetical protein